VFSEKDDAVDNEDVEEVDDVQIGGVVVDRVGFKDAKSALSTLKQFWSKNLLMLDLSFITTEHFERA
jgi:hypothetical protein